MKRPFKLAAVTALTVSMTALNAAPADACDKGNRRAFRAHVPFATSHRAYQPRYAQPVYRRTPAPVYVQPQPVFSQPQPVVQTQVPTVVGQPQAPVQSPIQQAPVQQVSAQRTPAQQTPVTQATVPQTTAAQPTTQPASSEATALQLLESMSDNSTSTDTTTQIPQFSAATSTATGTHVGTWKVTLPGNQSVELNLNQDGTFRWTATKNGKSSAFEGQYRMETGRLTLVRSSDLQQMAGNWTANGDNFTFKLDGTTTGGLAFARG